LKSDKNGLQDNFWNFFLFYIKYIVKN